MEKRLTWFQLMWKNYYIQYLLVILVFLVAVIAMRNTSYLVDLPLVGEVDGFYVGLLVTVGLAMWVVGWGFIGVWIGYKHEMKLEKKLTALYGGFRRLCRCDLLRF